MSRVRSECVRVLTVKPGTGDDDAGCTRTRVEEGVTRTEFYGFVSDRIILFTSSTNDLWRSVNSGEYQY